MNHRSPSCFLVAATAAAFTLPASAQLVQNLVLANGTHAWGTPYWTENVIDANAEAGVVDHLNTVWWLELHSPQVLLTPGTYIAQAKIGKLVDATLARDLTIAVVAGSTTLGSTVLPVAAQTIGSYVWSNEVIFTVHQPTTVDVAVLEVDTNFAKGDYRFDTARIGRVPVGRCVRHDSLDTWGFANPTYYDRYAYEPTATYGRVAQRNAQLGLTWLDLRRNYALPAGTHVASVRFRNLNGPGAGANDLTLAAFDNGALLTSVVVPASQQQAGQWVQAADLVLTLPAATTVTFALYNHVSQAWAAGYQFDSFQLRQVAPSFSAYGAGCGGLTLAQSAGGQLGQNLAFTLGNGGLSLVGLFAFGSPVAPVPLDFLGATGCLLHVTPDVVLSGVFVAGTCSTTFPVPNQPALFGLRLDLQGAALDPSAPGALKTANAGQAYLGL